MDVYGKTITRVGLVDDDPGSRNSMQYVVVDAALEPVPVDGPLPPLPEFLTLSTSFDAIICDHHLTTNGYADFDGAEIVAQAFDSGRLAVLCTRFTGSDLVSIRPYLPRIPVLLRPDELNEPDELVSALMECGAELSGQIPPERRAWRAQIVIDRIERDDGVIDLSIPGWEVEEAIRFRISDIPDLGDKLEVGFRCHAQVNLGTEDPGRLYVHHWELD